MRLRASAKNDDDWNSGARPVAAPAPEVAVLTREEW
jgi:hypothetical protein